MFRGGKAGEAGQSRASFEAPLPYPDREHSSTGHHHRSELPRQRSRQPLPPPPLPPKQEELEEPSEDWDEEGEEEEEEEDGDDPSVRGAEPKDQLAIAVLIAAGLDVEVVLDARRALERRGGVLTWHREMG